jgi:hypothetical protein
MTYHSERKGRPISINRLRKRPSATIPERYREISMKSDEKRRLDSREGVKRAATAEATSEREQGSRLEAGTSESTDRPNPKATKYKSEV